MTDRESDGKTNRKFFSSKQFNMLRNVLSIDINCVIYITL